MAKGSIQHNDSARHILLCLIRFLTVTTKTYNANNKKQPSQFPERAADVLRTGIEPVRALLPTGFSCYSCFYTSRLHP